MCYRVYDCCLPILYLVVVSLNFISLICPTYFPSPICNQNFVWTVSHGTDDLSSPTRNWTHSAFSGNIEVLSLNYSTAGKVCIFMSYTRFGCFQPRFWKIAVSAPFSFFSASGIPVEQMLDRLLLSQRFLRLLIFFF